VTSHSPDPTLRVLVSGVDHAEGVAWRPSSRALVFGTEGGEIWSFDVDSAKSQCLADGLGFILGVVVGPDDAIYACDMTNACVHRYLPGAGRLTRFSSGAAEDPMRVPNFAAFGQDGVLYVSDSGSCWDAADGTIWAVDVDGDAVRAISEPLSFPNGLAITPDGDHLMCVETFPPRLLEFELTGVGRLEPRRVVIDLPGTVPDGLAFTAEGDLLVACYRPDCVLQLTHPRLNDREFLASDSQGRLLAGSSNLCFFDGGLQRLAVANVAGNHLTEIETRHRGLGLRPWKDDAGA
jgi:gluconolactonase